MMVPLRKRHPIMKIMSMSLLALPAPVNISLWWNYGSLLGLFLMIQIISGIFISMHYNPSIESAFLSIIHISKDVNWGWMLHNMHMNGASFFLLFMYIHMGRGMYYNSFYLKETWNTGVTIFIMTVATAFMGYVLPWGQMSFWGATVITNIFSSIPYLGSQLVEWLWGSFAVNNATLNRFIVMHFLLPFITVFMVILHCMFLHKTGHVVKSSISVLSITSKMKSFTLIMMLSKSYTMFQVMICMIQASIFCLLISLYSNDHS